MKDNAFKMAEYGKKALTAFLALISIAYVFPVFMVVVNSFKENTFVKTETFAMPTGESFVGWANFIKGMTFGGFTIYGRNKIKQTYKTVQYRTCASG